MFEPKPCRLCLAAITLIFASSLAASAQTVKNNLGWSASLNRNTGQYTIITSTPDWTFSGTLHVAPTDVKASDGKDNLGHYYAIKFSWNENGPHTGAIRLYDNRPIVLFSARFDQPVNQSPAPFPVLSQRPGHLLELRFGEKAFMEPIAFHLHMPSDEQYAGPFVLFDGNDNAMILSPANDFMIARLSGDQKNGLASGLNAKLTSMPAGYTYETILAVGRGINHTWNLWGHALTNLYNKKRPANDADVGLKYIGYWTDNGSAYYYNYDPDRGYAGTLLVLKDHLEKQGIPIHYMQLDSWWYPKTFTDSRGNTPANPKPKNPKLPEGQWNRYGGLLTYTPSPFLFPNGMASFDRELALPLITHNRWIDVKSPYRRDYKVAGIAPVDPKWWNKIIGEIARCGVVTYEQDWNNEIYDYSPPLQSTTWAGAAYMDGMAHACQQHGLTMQYCMPQTRNLLQGGSQYSNLTTTRVSDDRFDRARWRQFFYGSRLASAFGVWPWTDVFRSSETANILISDLSAGMVGLSDAIGKENLVNIFHVIRRDGVIVKPDEPIVPIDRSVIADASGKKAPLICATQSQSDSKYPAYYLFAFNEADQKNTKSYSISPRELGLAGRVYMYNYFAGAGQLVNADQTYTQPFNDDQWAYTIAIPIGPSGIALIGDTSLFVTRGRQRIDQISDARGELRADVVFADDEDGLTVTAYAPSVPTVGVHGGSVAISYDPCTHLATVHLTRDPHSTHIKLTLRLSNK